MSYHSTFCLDEFDHYYTNPSIGLDPIVILQCYYIDFCATQSDRTLAIWSCGSVHRYHLFVEIEPWFWCAQCHLKPNKVDNHVEILSKIINGVKVWYSLGATRLRENKIAPILAYFEIVAFVLFSFKQNHNTALIIFDRTRLCVNRICNSPIMAPYF